MGLTDSSRWETNTAANPHFRSGGVSQALKDRRGFVVRLLVAHQILIASAVALAVLFALRSIAVYAQAGDGTELGIAAASLAIAAGLYWYFRKVRARWLADRDQRRL